MDIIIADSPHPPPLSSDWAILPIALEMDPRSQFVEFFVFCPPPPPALLAVVDIDEGLLLGAPLLTEEIDGTAAVALTLLPNAGTDCGRG